MQVEIKHIAHLFRKLKDASQNKNQHYIYHKDLGYSIEECGDLKKIEHLIKKGQLREFVQNGGLEQCLSYPLIEWEYTLVLEV